MNIAINTPKKKYVLIIPDGAGDLFRAVGRSPLAIARSHGLDFIAREGICGLMMTLYPDLPKESLVAQLGMLGWDPRIYYPCGRASCELLALEDIQLNEGDLAFRANLVRIEGQKLLSYNANYILSEQAGPLIGRLNQTLRQEFPDFELYHNSDFRNTLVLRRAGVHPMHIRCHEPHENQGIEFDMKQLIEGKNVEAHAVADRMNQYLTRVGNLLANEAANMIFPWSASKVLHLPSFIDNTGFEGKTAVVGAMDFLHGVAKAGSMEFFKVGNGRPNTDFEGKGAKVVELLSAGYEFVVCHINAPDEASHMRDVELKIQSLEMIDRFIAQPIVAYFQRKPEELGGVMITPDHYSNNTNDSDQLARLDAHSIHPVPFALWNGREQDDVYYYSEDDALNGKYGKNAISHLNLLSLLGVRHHPSDWKVCHISHSTSSDTDRAAC